MNELKIELKDGYNNLKEIYYKNGQGSIWTYKGTRTPIIISLILIGLSFTFYVISLVYPFMGWIFMMTICSLGVFIGIIYLGFVGRKYLNWKKSVTRDLNKISKYETHWITMTEKTMEISNRDETLIDKWENVKFVSINDEYIFIKSSNDNYILPGKSMTTEQYEDVKSFIKQRLNENTSGKDQVLTER